MSGYIYIIENENVPNSISVRETTLPIEDAMRSMKSCKCTHLWACDWPLKLEEAIREEYKDERSKTREDYLDKSVLVSLYLFIESYLKDEKNFSSETRDLLQATKDKQPTRADMSREERRLEEVLRAKGATALRRKKEDAKRNAFLYALKKSSKGSCYHPNTKRD